MDESEILNTIVDLERQLNKDTLMVRDLNEKDYDILTGWWKWWRWSIPEKDFLPGNATSGLMIEKNNIPIVAGFIYTSNSSLCYLDWIISNPKYREKDRKQAIELLISEAENKMKKKRL